MVETAILGSSLLGAGASIIGGNEAAKAQKKGLNQATALSREQFNKGLEITAPFRDVGISALPGLHAITQGPVTPFKFRDANTFLTDYFQGPEYNSLNTQAQDQILRNAAATGGFRSGGTQANLAMIAPTLGIQALQRQNSQDLQEYGTNQAANADQFNQLYGLANLGANISTGNANAGANFASQAGQNAIMAGQAKAQNYMNTAGAITGIASDYAGLKLYENDLANGRQTQLLDYNQRLV
jgi:hypothetical protein